MIEGKNIIIRPMELGDEEYLHKWRNDNQAMAYCELNYGFMVSKEAFRQDIRKQVETMDIFPHQKTFIICNKEDLKPIGNISYRSWDKRLQSAEFGLEIGELEYRGKGYGYDILNSFIDFMFKFLNLNRVELKVLSTNTQAQTLYQKLGFKTIGVIREGTFDSRSGKFLDVIYMDLLKSEWRKEQT